MFEAPLVFNLCFGFINTLFIRHAFESYNLLFIALKQESIIVTTLLIGIPVC